MRYMLTGDHWGADEAYRMGVIQEIAANPAKALEAGIGLAEKIAVCGPLGIKTTLESAQLTIDESEAEGRPPVHQGK
jgi:enoyl-CoA hydratase